MSPPSRTMFAKLLTVAALMAALASVACGGQEAASTTVTGGAPTDSATASQSASPTTQSTVGTTDLEPIVVPTLPAEIPGYTEVDPATGLHVTGTPQVIDIADYRLTVSGKVTQELHLTYDEVRSLPKMTATPKLTCPGVFQDITTWSGVPISAVLEMAEVQPEATKIKMTSADGYWVYLALEEARLPENFLAYEWMDEPLPVLHGFPLRAVIPDRYGSYWVKWLVEIQVE
jgi:DMSO/TMAO reductase YedYZ molybdopterin-dependent catalytic subunit